MKAKITKMQLIADSGSTKTSWRIVKNQNIIGEAYTIGYNPHYLTTTTIVASLKESLISQLPVPSSEIENIYFYGTGCSTVDGIKVITDAFEQIFENAITTVNHDLLGAARALCGREPGIGCILGTGSNSCLYDGKEIVDNIPSLGYILGDEGAGVSLGRNLIRAFFYREMPEYLSKIFYDTYKMDKNTIYHEIYKSEYASRFMAQHTKFLSQYIHHDFIHDLVKKEMNRFVDAQISKYKGIDEYPVHFVGSIAFHFKDIIETVLQERGYTLGKIIQAPIDDLVKYHNE